VMLSGGWTSPYLMRAYIREAPERALTNPCQKEKKRQEKGVKKLVPKLKKKI